MMPPLVLASTSPYRRQLLDRFGLTYQTATPNVRETMQPGESAEALVARLSVAKARSVAPNFSHALIIGSDQVACLRHMNGSPNLPDQQKSEVHGPILGKPGHHQAAVMQLRQASGQQVDFFTGLCVYNTSTDQHHVEVIPYQVTFRTLSHDTIERYLQREKPYNCAGSFKSEGLGIALFERMTGEDPTALIGLPLIALRRLLQHEGFDVIQH